MPADIENCVKKVNGTNKRTGKPYTTSEKWAICQAMHKKSSKSEAEELIELEKEISDTIDRCIQKLLKNGKAKTYEQASALYDALLAKSGYDFDILESLVDKE